MIINITPSAAANPKSYEPNALEYIYAGSVCEEFAGPPSVMITTRSSELKIQIVRKSTVVINVGLI